MASEVVCLIGPPSVAPRSNLRKARPALTKLLFGDRMQSTALDYWSSLIEATDTRARQKALLDANLGFEQLRFLFRLATDMRFLDQRRYEHAGPPVP